MLVYDSLDNYPTEKHVAAIATIGNFDGMHLGHMSLINKQIAIARDERKTSMVITFWPHPQDFLQKRQSALILERSERQKFFRNKGFDVCIELPFNEKTRNLQPKSFIEDILIKKLSISKLCIGQGFKFGLEKAGDIELLETYKSFFKTETLKLELYDTHTISSNTIREFIRRGEINKANNFLGYNFFLETQVKVGKQRGSSIGFPTANLDFGSKVQPKFGVYIVIVKFNNLDTDVKFSKIGVANFGLRPTFGDLLLPLLEVHILNFAGNLYNQRIKVEFLKFLRPEMHFGNLQELTNQIKIDIDNAKAYAL